MTTRSAPRQAERGRRRALLVAGSAGDGSAKFAPPSTSGRSPTVPPIRRHRATRGFVHRDTEYGGGNLPEPFSLDGPTWRTVNGVVNLATPFSPSLSVTVVEYFPHRATRGFVVTAYCDGGATLAHPCRLRLCRPPTGVHILHPRRSEVTGQVTGVEIFLSRRSAVTVVANRPHRATWGFTDLRLSRCRHDNGTARR